VNLRQRLLLMFAAVVFITVGLVAWTVSLRTRSAFEQMDQQRTAALTAQIQNEFQREGDQVASIIGRVSASDEVQRIASSVTHGGDTSLYLRDASSLAHEYQLDFLELVQADGTIISSAQWPAHYGYKRQISPSDTGTASLKSEELQNGLALGLIASRAVHSADGTMYVVGGIRLDRKLLDSLSVPTGMYVWLYRKTGAVDAEGDVLGPSTVSPEQVRKLARAAEHGQESTGFVQITAERNDRASVQAIPLKDATGAIPAVLLVGNLRKPLLELQQNIKTTAFAVAGIGILLAIAVSLWLAARFSRPIEQLAAASHEVAGGNWDVQVEPGPGSEMQLLAESFNTMTRQLVNQRDRLVQSERVAAWRELARRLAHELKNPLFPLQITVENLVRARELAPQEFDEIFRESTSTLLAELTNLKTIIGRFSDFSKMPKPQLAYVSVNDLIRQVATLHAAQLSDPKKPVKLDLQLDTSLTEIPLDADLFHRVLSNLVLNAIDAMPEGGTLSIRTSSTGECARIEIGDTGIGLTSEERSRLFTPYYTTKQQGTGLGLAVVQSVVSDHRGTISVTGETGRGTTFIIDLPRNMDETQPVGTQSGASA
jgi:two-component system nitrogen regulation sensor histidine kinase NtrY